MRRLPALLAFYFCLCMMLGMQESKSGEVEFSYTNSLDGTIQKALAYIPTKPAAKKSPLLVTAHPLGGDRNWAKTLAYPAECEKRGWFMVSPDLHGKRTPGQTAFASLEAQHDVLDCINYMKSNHSIDSSRVYMVGRSMGGMLTQIMGAKHPDLFAGIVAGQGVSDLFTFRETAPKSLIEQFESECLPLSAETKFDYQRRSSINYATNLQYVPLVLWHGTNDRTVVPQQSMLLEAALGKETPFPPTVHWLQGAAHNPVNFPPEWECDQLKYFVNTCDGKMEHKTRFYPKLHLIFDEPGKIFWLDITPARENEFAEITAEIADDTCTIKAKNIKRIGIDQDRILHDSSFSKYSISTDVALEFSIVSDGKEIFKKDVGYKAKGSLSNP